MGITAKKIMVLLQKFPAIRTIVYCAILIAIFIQPVMVIYQKKDVYFSPGYSKKYESFKSLYYSSQYVQKKNPSIIPDNILESFAGGAFLKGMNPILIIHDQPPLGRYITALSILLFDNQLTMTVPLLFLSLIALYFLSRAAIKNKFLVLIPVGIFANEPLFLSKFSFAPLIETMQLPFIILSFYFFYKGVTSKKFIFWFIFTSIMIGFVISIRLLVIGAGMITAMTVYFFLIKDRRKMFAFFLTLPLCVFILLLSYFKTIQDGSSVLHIFGIQKYILYYHSSKFILPFTFWDLLLFNRWHTWWEDWSISSDPQWTILWPVSVFLSIFFLVKIVIKNIKANAVDRLIFLWIGIVCLILSTGFTSTRNFLPVVPFFYILAVSLLDKIFLRYHNRFNSESK